MYAHSDWDKYIMIAMHADKVLSFKKFRDNKDQFEKEVASVLQKLQIEEDNGEFKFNYNFL